MHYKSTFHSFQFRIILRTKSLNTIIRQKSPYTKSRRVVISMKILPPNAYQTLYRKHKETYTISVTCNIAYYDTSNLRSVFFHRSSEVILSYWLIYINTASIYMKIYMCLYHATINRKNKGTYIISVTCNIP